MGKIRQEDEVAKKYQQAQVQSVLYGSEIRQSTLLSEVVYRYSVSIGQTVATDENLWEGPGNRMKATSLRGMEVCSGRPMFLKG